MNFDIAGEILAMEKIESTTVLVSDDVASAKAGEKGKRRGAGAGFTTFRPELMEKNPEPRGKP